MISFCIILIFTLFDYLVHSLSPDYDVPSYYFRNKAIFGTLLCFVTLLIVRRRSTLVKTAVIATTVSILLQTRYAIEGYPTWFVLGFLVVHFVTLSGASLAVLTITDRITPDSLR